MTQKAALVEDLAYAQEEEFRLLWTSSTEKALTKNFKFSREAIDRIVINPWLHPSLVKAVEKSILSIPDFSNLKVKQSKVTDGPAWKRLAEKYA